MSSKIDVINKEGRAIEEAVAWHTVGIVAEDGQSIGTGSAILWRQRPLILTAGHLIRGSPGCHTWFFFCPQETIKRSPITGDPRPPAVRYNNKLRIKQHRHS